MFRKVNYSLHLYYALDANYIFYILLLIYFVIDTY